MEEPAILLTLAVTALMAVGLLSAAALKVWQGWLDLRRLEMEQRRPAPARMDVADLKERIRRLEAIAAGEA